MIKKLEDIGDCLSDEEVDVVLGVAYVDMSEEDVVGVKRYLDKLREDRWDARACALTGMRNRRAWNEDFEGELDSLCRGNSKVHSLLYLDVDFFKDVNDSYGHAAGDDVLRALGKTMFSNIRDCDSAYRLGGDEFLVLFRDTSIYQAIKPALKLDKAIYDYGAVVKGRDNRKARHNTELSGGLIEIRGDHAAVELYRKGNVEDAIRTVVEESDALLYYAKENGRGNIAVKSGSGIALLKD